MEIPEGKLKVVEDRAERLELNKIRMQPKSINEKYNNGA